MRVAPGARIALHRHPGPTLQGARLLSDGGPVEAGDEVFVPIGHVDWWEAAAAATRVRRSRTAGLAAPAPPVDFDFRAGMPEVSALAQAV